MRLRLRCSSTYALGDLQRCMVHVPEHLQTVRDLAGHISRLLELNVRGGGAELPQLLLDGFLVPDDEEVRAVLRDDEVVDVEPTEGVGMMPLQNGANALQLACRAAAPAAEGSATPSGKGKRSLGAVVGTNGTLPGSTLEVSSSSTPASKRLKQNGASSAAAMAIGWQSPDAKAPAAPAAVATKSAAVAAANAAVKAAPPASCEESEEDDSEDEDDSDSDAQAEKPKLRGKKGGGKDAAALAQAAALATCGTESTSTATSSEENRGVFVGGLGYDVDDDKLLQFFATYGEVESAVVVCNQHTGKSKGFGFVEFVQADTRAKVLAAGDKLQIAGRECQVKPRQAKGGKDGGKDRGKGKDKGKQKGKGKDKDKGKGKGKGKGKDTAEIPRPHPVAKPKPRQAEESDSDDEEEESEEEEDAPPAAAKRPQAATAASAPTATVPAANAPALAALAATPAAPAAAHAEKGTGAGKKVASKTPAISASEAEVQKQMAALGLPVSFTASEMPGGSDGEEESEEESEEDA
mmetsp:Transcript_148810/g.284958  ORF Transcript_148810/g.284958 Transcript_148810/m.284958 type:complete len:522 (+) Transcript_148810:107-1672(+)